MATSCELTEATYQGTNRPVVDREGGYIRNAKILGKISANGREYSDASLQEAKALYEGLGVNLNHPERANPGKERQFQDGIGWLENVQVRDDGVYGDIGVLKEDPMAGKLFEAAERRPDRFGLSHNASGNTTRKGNKTIVESITRVRSVDIVQNPATNKSFFESKDEDTMPQAQTRTLQNLVESLPAKSKHRKAVSALLEEFGGPMPGDMPVDMSAAMPADATAETAAPDSEATMRAAFKSAVSAVMDDTAIGVTDMLMKIEAILNAQAAALGIDIEAGETEPPPAGGDAAVTESLQEQVKELLAERAELKAEATARTLLESKGIKVTPERIEMVKSVTKKPAQTALLESLKASDGPAEKTKTRPLASPGISLLESAGDAEDIADTPEKMRKKYA